jgi:membrane-bound ClpP family serine protease
MGFMAKFFGAVTCLGLLIFLAGFLSLFRNQLGFSSFMTPEDWNKFQALTISGGMFLSWIAGTLAYVFLRRKDK